jgi:hypothetical protein
VRNVPEVKQQARRSIFSYQSVCAAVAPRGAYLLYSRVGVCFYAAAGAAKRLLWL